MATLLAPSSSLDEMRCTAIRWCGLMHKSTSGQTVLPGAMEQGPAGKHSREGGGGGKAGEASVLSLFGRPTDQLGLGVGVGA